VTADVSGAVVVAGVILAMVAAVRATWSP